MKIYNTTKEYPAIVRTSRVVQLYKVINEYTETKVDEETKKETKIVTGRDYECITIPRTTDTDIVTTPAEDGQGEPTVTDPVAENFNKLFADGLLAEQTLAYTVKYNYARNLRWNVTSKYTLEHKGFTNLMAERNITLQIIARNNVINGDDVRWMNLDGEYIQITEENKADFIEFTALANSYTQASFDALNSAITKIKAVGPESIVGLDPNYIWDSAWETYLTNWESAKAKL